MNFKEIRLVGFKSFADKTSVQLDDGVTCIVGPNGCGKSNVADAVRWVLGEQSAKTLRGSSMQDVIFGGTESRRSLSYCEVTLVFDNTERIFDTDYQEIAITRRLYRSGDSQYLINNRECRLKEIVSILHSAGIGAVEDDVLHARAAEGLGGLLAEHPPDCVRDVALAAPVRADDTGDTVVKNDARFIRKGFEAYEPYFLKVHSVLSLNNFNKFSAAAASACFLAIPKPSASLPSARTLTK